MTIYYFKRKVLTNISGIVNCDDIYPSISLSIQSSYILQSRVCFIVKSHRRISVYN